MNRNTIFSLLLCLANFLLSGMLVSQTAFNITIERKSTSEKCTMGYLSVNKKVICYSLELPWKDNQNNVSCIPKGTYKGILRYDKKDGWRIQLENVPNRTAVQIHMGNYTTDTKGCVLVGTNARVGDCSVQGSLDAYKQLKLSFYGSENPVSTPNYNINVSFL